jgi:alkylated DNA repair dioxygenase AlkB
MPRTSIKLPAAQPGLFANGPIVLATDGETGIVYTPAAIDARSAQCWFESIRAGAAWSSERRLMYDREVDVPRLVARYRLDEKLPPGLNDAAIAVANATGVDFNSVGLNWYRDGRDSVAPHNDRLEELVPGFPIVLLSLGTARRMVLQEKAHARRTLHVDLEPGSLLSMSYAAQHDWLHGIPKVRDAAGERISLAFRVRPA